VRVDGAGVGCMDVGLGMGGGRQVLLVGAIWCVGRLVACGVGRGSGMGWWGAECQVHAWERGGVA
jgi:hypothetical protein